MTANVQPPEDIDTDWASITLRAFNMAIAVGAIEPADDEEPDPWAADMPGWRRAAAEYHSDRAGRVLSGEPRRLARLRRLMAEDVSIDRAWQELNDVRNWSTPKATIDAVWWAICERGMSALAEPRIADRIASFDEAARSELDRRIANIGV
jgi:hypothetical protein